MAGTTIDRTLRTTVRRVPERASYDRDLIYAVLDEGLVCHVGLAVEGQPYVIPMSYGRSGDKLILHGSSASRLLTQLSEGAPTCVTVTLLDGLVLARSATHHSVNYRSVMLFGRARAIQDPEKKRQALTILLEHTVPGRAEDVRPPSDAELAATIVIELPIEEASAKTRSGPPQDADADLQLAAWAGVLPLRTTSLAPEPDPKLAPGIDVPGYVSGYRRPSGTD